jgi:hypothetical protein
MDTFSFFNLSEEVALNSLPQSHSFNIETGADDY